MDDLIGEFITETSESLAALDLAKLEQNPGDQAILGNISRLLHTIKGTCGFLGLPRLESIAHASENVLGKVRDGAIVLTPDAVPLVLEPVDCIKRLVDHLAEKGYEPEGEDRDLLTLLNIFAETNGAVALTRPAVATAPKFEEPCLDSMHSAQEIKMISATAQAGMDKSGRVFANVFSTLRSMDFTKAPAAPSPPSQENISVQDTISVLLVEAGGQKFALPLPNVVELVYVGGASEHKIETIDNAPMLRLRDTLLPLIKLRDILQIPPAHSNNDCCVAVLRVGAASFALTLDKVHDIEEITVKPASFVLDNIDVYAGNAILADGSVTMILDPEGLAKALRNDETDAVSQPAEEKTDSFLVFKAGLTQKAVPLERVARLEVIAAAKIEHLAGEPVMHYHGGLMHLTTLSGMSVPVTGLFHVVVFIDNNRTIGLVVDAIADIIEAPLASGSIIIDGNRVDIIDVDSVLRSPGSDVARPTKRKVAA